MIEKKLLFRTMLFAPGHNEKIIHKAALSDADALVLDLEDSCKPDSNKAKAREVIKRIVGSGELKKYFVFVRINPRETGFMFKDISELTIKGINGFLYPMANSEKDIIFFSNLLTEIEMSKGIKKGYFKIFPVIETAEGILNARKICAASKRVVALGFGSEDFTTDLHSIRDEEGVSIFIPRANIALAARSQGV
ncbi:MAG: HpcH/HpaI aldolase/citrate lyase family protein, partial [Bacteroidales bacterium]|nr:HpcH/HpaI aldolase/citrate lyase family protein [Bacteroidales bacterium]